MRVKYKMIGPCVVRIPPGIKFEVQIGAKLDPVLIPLEQHLEDYDLEGWDLVKIIEGFPLEIPHTIAIAGRPSKLTLVGVCALLKKRKD